MSERSPKRRCVDVGVCIDRSAALEPLIGDVIRHNFDNITATMFRLSASLARNDGSTYNDDVCLVDSLLLAVRCESLFYTPAVIESLEKLADRIRNPR